MSAAATGVTTAVTIVITGLVFAKLSKGADALAVWDAEDETIELTHGMLVRRILPGLCLLLPGAAVVGMVVGAIEEDWRVVFLCVPLFLLFGWGALMAFREGRHRLLASPSAVRWIKSPDVEVSTEWSEIRRVKFSSFWGALIIEDAAGQKIRASMWLRGFSMFEELLRGKVDKKKTKGALEKMQAARKAFGG